MTIQEAIKSGKRMRLKGYTCWYKMTGQSSQLRDETGTCHYPSKEELLSTDWELEPKKRTLTSEDIIEAVARVNKNTSIWGIIHSDLLISLLSELDL